MAPDLQSPPSPSSSLSSSPPALDPSTLSVLDSFLAQKAEETRLFDELAEQAAARVAGLALNDDEWDDELDEAAGSDSEESKRKRKLVGSDTPMMSVDEYRVAFGEDWQLSQFWYTTRFANHLARALHALTTPTSTIAFICCPTAFVAYQHLHARPGAKLLEIDTRFAVLAPRDGFVLYDLNDPDAVPADLHGAVDVAVVDPPFLNESTNAKLAQTLRLVLHPARGKLVLVTSTTAIEDVVRRVYSEPPLGPLRPTAMEVEHGRLANDFTCWGSWEGAEEFGREDLQEQVSDDVDKEDI